MFTISMDKPSSRSYIAVMQTQGSQEILKMELAQRQEANPAYSMRAMARQLKLSPSMLSALLSGKKKLSAERAFDIAKRLKFDRKKSLYFVTCVHFERAKSPEQKMEWLEKVNALSPGQKTKVLNLDLFRIIADWHHFAVLELTHTQNFTADPLIISKSLGISPAEAEAALERLLRLELLEETPEKSLRKSNSHLLADSPMPNGALRKYHEQMLEKAKTSLHTQTSAEKFVGSETFAFDETELKKATEIMEDCFSRIVQLASTKKDKKHVYHLGIQLFRLTKELS